MLTLEKAPRQFVAVVKIMPLLLLLTACGTWATDVGESVNEAINLQDDSVDRPNEKVILKERETQSEK